MDDQKNTSEPNQAPVEPKDPEPTLPGAPQVNEGFQSSPPIIKAEPVETAPMAEPKLSVQPVAGPAIVPEEPRPASVPIEPMTVQTTPPMTSYQPPVQPVVVAPTLPTIPGESASEFQHRVIQSEQVKEVKQARRSYKLENAVGVLMGSIEASLAIRLAFKLLGAKPTNGFVNFLYQFTGVFANPFEGIFGANPMFGNFELDIGAIIGMIIYAVVGFGALKLVKLF